MSTFVSQDAIVQSRQLKVQRLVIPFKVTANATSANIGLANDESSRLFLQTKSVDNGIATQDSAANAAYNTLQASLSDTSGQMNVLVVLKEKALKVMQAMIISRTDGTTKACYPDAGSTNGASAAGNLMLYAPTGVNFTTTSLDACLIVEYVISGEGS